MDKRWKPRMSKAARLAQAKIKAAKAALEVARTELRHAEEADFLAVTGMEIGGWVLFDGQPAILQRYKRYSEEFYDRDFPPFLQVWPLTKGGRTSKRAVPLYNEWLDRLKPWPADRPWPEVKEADGG